MIKPLDDQPIIRADGMRVSAAILEFIRDAKTGGLLPVDNFSGDRIAGHLVPHNRERH